MDTVGTDCLPSQRVMFPGAAGIRQSYLSLRNGQQFCGGRRSEKKSGKMGRRLCTKVQPGVPHVRRRERSFTKAHSPGFQSSNGSICRNQDRGYEEFKGIVQIEGGGGLKPLRRSLQSHRTPWTETVLPHVLVCVRHCEAVK